MYRSGANRCIHIVTTSCGCTNAGPAVQESWSIWSEYHAGSSLTLREKIMPARGPLRDLWVVVVTMSQNSKGWSASCAATKPLHDSQHNGLQLLHQLSGCEASNMRPAKKARAEENHGDRYTGSVATATQLLPGQRVGLQAVGEHPASQCCLLMCLDRPVMRHAKV